VRIYIFPESPNSESLLNYFFNINGSVIHYSLKDPSASERFLAIIRILIVLGVEVTPPDMPCFDCLNLTWDDLLMIYDSPLVGFFHNGKLTAISIGITDYKILDQAFLVKDEKVKIFTLYGSNIHLLNDEETKTQLEGLLLGREVSKKETNILTLVLPVTLLALADSVNPCTFAVFTALLLITLNSIGKNRMVTTGVSFIVTVFICYYFLGLGIFRVLAAFSYMNKVIGILGLAIGAFGITHGLRPKWKSPLPKFLRKLMNLQINKSYTSPTGGFILGLVASFTLLPCSGGPYIVGLGLLYTLNQPIQAYFLLSLYNAIFVTPLIIILVIVSASSIYSRRIKIIRSTRLGVMELFNSLLLIIVCIYLLLS